VWTPEQSGRGGEEKKPWPCREKILGCPGHSVVTILIELPAIWNYMLK